MKKLFLKRSICLTVTAAMAAPQLAFSAPLVLAQFPAGSASRAPAPNVILSVDDSGSMGTSGINTLKSALRTTFAASNVPDGAVRLAWQAMWRCNTIPHPDCSNANSMKPLEGAHRARLMTWIDGLVPANGTPSHKMMRNAGAYMMTTGLDNPFNHVPGVIELPVQACRRSYHIFMTDGEWNQARGADGDSDRRNPSYLPLSPGNIDGTNTMFPDGTSYVANSDQTRIYRDNWGVDAPADRRINTLSDLSFYYWKTDLQPGIPNNVAPLNNFNTSVNISDGGTSVLLSPYWNPRNNPATWQSLTTYSIGFRPTVTSWGGQPAWGGDTYSGGYNRLILGTAGWVSPLCGALGDAPCDVSGGGNPTTGRKQDLWHMAINSRGKFFTATQDSDLVTAFQDIIGTIVADSSTPVAGFTGSGASVSRTGLKAFRAGYEAANWNGYVLSETLSQGTGDAVPNTAWGTVGTPARPKTTADKLDELNAAGVDARLILSYNNVTNLGVPFTWSALGSPLSPAQQLSLNTVGPTADTLGRNRLNYLRGDRSREQSQPGGDFRNRISRQGDIVNSNVWYLGAPSSNSPLPGYRSFAASHKNRTPMLYVGGNDGMLHGFSAVDGVEKIAYVPQGLIGNLSRLTQPGYVHRYYVDGSPFSGDIDIGTPGVPNWRTMLVGTLGAGGKGFFVLDATQPGFEGLPPGVPSNFSSANAASLVVMDKTDGADPDIGHMFGQPLIDDANPEQSLQIAQMNDGRWALITGNGYNSTNEKPVLLIQYLDGDKALVKLTAASSGAEATGNGLSTPRLLDINADGRPDVAYAGDLRGNLWKFDISNASAASWNVAFSGTPLYTAAYVSGFATTRQPIFAPPSVSPNRKVGGLMVAIGTGRNVTESDRTDISVQTVYSVRDNTRYKIDTITGPNKGRVLIDTAVTPTPVGTGRTDLVAQRVVGSAITGSGASTGRSFWQMENNIVDYSAKKGWYFDMPIDGERVLDAMSFYDGSTNLEVVSEVPGSGGNSTEETCTPSSRSVQRFRTFLNIEGGLKPGAQILNTNGDAFFNSADQGTSRMTASPKEFRFATKKTEIRKGSDGRLDTLAKLPEILLRPSWRQLQ